MPVATCQYWHRSLDPKKLIAVGFSRLQPRMTLARTLKLYKIPDTPQIPGIRLMRPADSVKVGHMIEALNYMVLGRISRLVIVSRGLFNFAFAPVT